MTHLLYYELNRSLSNRGRKQFFFISYISFSKKKKKTLKSFYENLFYR